jgi:hypothetical protein
VKHPDCRVCKDLWDEYARAIHRYLRIGNRHQTVVYEHDLEALRVLGGELAEAEAARDSARDAIRDHEGEPRAQNCSISTTVSVVD